MATIHNDRWAQHGDLVAVAMGAILFLALTFSFFMPLAK